MRRPHLHIIWTLLGCLGAVGCGAAARRAEGPVGPAPVGGSPDATPLRALAERRGIRIGAAADAGFRWGGADGAQFRALLAREFSVLTPENDMKHARIHPDRGLYRFAPADSLVAFAEANGMRVRGHTLVWHRQLAGWLTARVWTRDEVGALLAEHIDSVVGHYRGRLLAWDVVNEALDEDGSLRRTFWSSHLGPDYIDLAFRRAHAADPGVALFYNDYNVEGINPKSDSAYALVRRLLARGVPIHGVGLQAHFQLGGVPPSLGANIERFAALGLKVHITELDIRVPQPSTPAQLERQAQEYREVVGACLRHPACEVVVLWGVTDRASWIPGEWLGWGEAHLFDAALRPKPAYWALQRLLAER